MLSVRIKDWLDFRILLWNRWETYSGEKTVDKLLRNGKRTSLTLWLKKFQRQTPIFLKRLWSTLKL